MELALNGGIAATPLLNNTAAEILKKEKILYTARDHAELSDVRIEP